MRTGPYRSIRHPIYTGIIVALVGTALATSLLGLIVAAVLHLQRHQGGAVPGRRVP